MLTVLVAEAVTELVQDEDPSGAAVGGEQRREDELDLTSHPCALVTSGPQYVPTVEAVRVRRYKQIKPEDWHRLGYDVLPLPDLVEDSGEHWAAVFTERGPDQIPRQSPMGRNLDESLG